MSDYAKLLAEREAIDAKLAALKHDALLSVWKQIDDLLEKNKVTRDEFVSHYFTKRPSKKGTAVAAKYSDGTNQWSGRGARPRWLAAALEKDKKLTIESFLIKK